MRLWAEERGSLRIVVTSSAFECKLFRWFALIAPLRELRWPKLLGLLPARVRIEQCHFFCDLGSLRAQILLVDLALVIDDECHYS